ncbi:efflux RND transporter permease subunit [Salinibacter grassmerensis]|uniref:efflux RND transporter permease subunit n=1 Tax=Salinibacter grassmerensis TaxID=3040353 RepID=UPI0021E75DB3|nr:efflux RND transporter permease subunit [Salinibacter grassmerensis]
MDIAKAAIENRTLTYVTTLLVVVGGVIAFLNLGRLEDPEFTIKRALVVTQYPGATAHEVEEEVSDPIEEAVQEMGKVKEIKSRSSRGRSTLEVEMKSDVIGDAVTQAFDDLRDKVNDAQGRLPPGAGPSAVEDDFGDVYGIFMAITGEGYSKEALKNHAEDLKRELVQVQDVAKVRLFADRQETIYVEPNRNRLSNLGISVDRIAGKLRTQNIVVDAGRVRVGDSHISVRPSGATASLDDLRSILIASQGGRQIFLEDIATVRRGYADPPRAIMRYDGQPAIGLGVSTVDGGNVVTMGRAVQDRLDELKADRPLGIEYNYINFQAEDVSEAVSGFVWNLVTAIAIVIVVLLLAMGWRSGLLMGFLLAVTVLGTFILMYATDVVLQRISLGALIIALGMLVDNAVVIVDGILTRLKEGRERVEAASEIVEQTKWPLFGATAVAILGFAAIGTSSDSSGEFLGSLFLVILYSLSLSWLLSVTLAPLLGVDFLKKPDPDEEVESAHDGPVYTAYRRLLQGAINYRWVTVAVITGLMGLSLWGAGAVKQSFFPDSTRPQFLVDVWMPQGTHIRDTEAAVKEAEQYVQDLDAVTHVSSVVGQGALRFVLPYSPERQNSSYGQLIVDVDDWRKISSLKDSVDARLSTMLPRANVYAFPFVFGPGGGTGRIQARISGPNPDSLRAIAQRVEGILQADDNTKAVRNNWRNRVEVTRPQVAEDAASALGVTRPDVARAIQRTFEGTRMGVYREESDLLPIMMRAPSEERARASNMKNTQVWSPVASEYVPIRQVVSGFGTGFEDGIVWRYKRSPTVSVYADPISGTATSVFQRVRPVVEELSLPRGYEISWGGQYENSNEANASLLSAVPIFFVLMVLITVALFNALRQPLIIWLTVPLALIGVVAGLLATGAAFGFTALLGFLSLSGLLIKNAVVVIDEIEIWKQDESLYQAIVGASVVRLRPVMMASITTALGMIPLFTDAFFVAMAVTITSGLLFATVLTMIVVPVLYAILFGVERLPYSER